MLKFTTSDKRVFFLGSAVHGERVAVIGSVRLDSGVAARVMERTGDLWPTLVRSMDDGVRLSTELDGLVGIMLLTTDRDLFRSLNRPFPVSHGAPPAQWEMLRRVGGPWAGRFQCIMAPKLPNAEALFNQSFGKEG